MDTTMWDTHCKQAFDEVKSDVKGSVGEVKSEIIKVRKILLGNGEAGLVDTVRDHKRFFRAMWGVCVFVLILIVTQAAIWVRTHIADDLAKEQIMEALAEIKSSR